MSKQKQIDQLEFRVAEMTKINMLFPRLKEHFNDLQAKYAAVCAELEAAQGEIDRLKSLNDNLAFTISTAKMVTNQVKAATIRVAMDAIGSRWSSDTGTLMINADLLNDYASQLERGEL